MEFGEYNIEVSIEMGTHLAELIVGEGHDGVVVYSHDTSPRAVWLQISKRQSAI